MSQELYKVLEGLIAQNHRLGQKQIAMECICSSLLAQVALLSRDPTGALDGINSELCGTAMGVAALSRTFGPDTDTETITATIETVAELSEKALAFKRVPAVVPAWS